MVAATCFAPRDTHHGNPRRITALQNQHQRNTGSAPQSQTGVRPPPIALPAHHVLSCFAANHCRHLPGRACQPWPQFLHPEPAGAARGAHGGAFCGAGPHHRLHLLGGAGARGPVHPAGAAPVAGNRCAGGGGGLSGLVRGGAAAVRGPLTPQCRIWHRRANAAPCFTHGGLPVRAVDRGHQPQGGSVLDQCVCRACSLACASLVPCGNRAAGYLPVAGLAPGDHLGITWVFGNAALRRGYLRMERAVNGLAGGALVLLGIQRLASR